MKSIALLFLVVAGCSASLYSEIQYQSLFTSFMKEYSKTYQHDELFHRYNTFKSWVDFVDTHNAGNNTWEAGLNEFSDLTPAEFEAIYLTGLNIAPEDKIVLPESEEVSFPSNDIDWREKGAVTPVKNQGSCGSCWAFSAIGIVEGWGFNTGGTLYDLSEQQLVDCAGSYGNQGCNGGWHDKAVDYLADVGSCHQEDYPYTARTGTCKKTCKPVITPNKSVRGSTEAALTAALNNGPVGVAVDASGGFQSYRSGVFTGPCGTNLNHAILAVGFVSTGTPYWIVKNSWGTNWGFKGYINMASGKNLCGINMHTAWVKQ